MFYTFRNLWFSILPYNRPTTVSLITSSFQSSSPSSSSLSSTSGHIADQVSRSGWRGYLPVHGFVPVHELAWPNWLGPAGLAQLAWPILLGPTGLAQMAWPKWHVPRTPHRINWRSFPERLHIWCLSSQFSSSSHRNTILFFFIFFNSLREIRFGIDFAWT